MKKLLCLLFALLLCFSLCACGGGGNSAISSSSKQEEAVNPGYLKGVGEPFATSTIKGFNYNVASELLGALGSKTFRMWLSDNVLYPGYSNTTVYSDEQLAQISMAGKLQIGQYIDALKENGIEEIVGLGCFLPKVESTAKFSYANNYVPEISTEEGSDYHKFLNKVYVIYKAVSAAFPQITVWEMGNETNQNAFMGTPNKELTQEELAYINVEYMYYATKGVKEGNPNAITIPAGFAPIEEGMPSIARFYEKIYANIKGGNFPSFAEKTTATSDYFQGLCWHAYDIKNGLVTNSSIENKDLDEWKAQNDMIYNVAVKNGDAHLKAWITEFGFTLSQNQLRVTTAEDTSVTRYKLSDTYYDLVDVFEQYQADYTKAYFKKLEEMDYVNSVHFFRLFCSEQGMHWNGFGEVYFGLFLEPDETVGRGFYPRKKAYAVQEVFGGTGDITKYAAM